MFSGGIASINKNAGSSAVSVILTTEESQASMGTSPWKTTENGCNELI